MKTHARTSQSQLTQFLMSQPRVRVIIDDAGNYGNQAANYNLMQRMRQMGFSGIFEIVYFNNAKDKILKLFDIAPQRENNFYSERHAIELIQLDEFIRRSDSATVQPYALGVSGAVDLAPSMWERNIQDDNFANIMNVDTFVRFSPYYGIDDLCDTEIYQRGILTPVVQAGSCNQMLITPTATLADAIDYVSSTENGQALLQSNPALSTLISHIQDQSINFQALYGWTLRESPSNLINMVAGARYAQLHGGNRLRRPLVMGAFFDLTRENFYQRMQYNIGVSNLDIFNRLVMQDDWAGYEDLAGASEAQAAIRDLNLQQSVRVAFMNDTGLDERIAALTSDEILLVSLPPLPKVVFDGLFTHHASNIFPPVREGASSLTSLVSVTGRPHIHCRSERDWDINLDLAPQVLLPELKGFNEIICRERYTANLNFEAWQRLSIDKIIAMFIVEAFKPNSILSQYFLHLKDHALQPENDRIAQDLNDAVELITPGARAVAAASVQQQVAAVAPPPVRLAITAPTSVSAAQPPAHQVPVSAVVANNSALRIHKQLHAARPANDSLLDRMCNAISSYAKEVVAECPSYFPPEAPDYWQQQGQKLSTHVYRLNSINTSSSLIGPPATTLFLSR